VLVQNGEHTFYPVGAPNVRIAFTMQNDRARRVEIVEDAWLVVATRE